MLKLRAEPDSPAAGHWQREVAALLDQARDAFTPRMCQRLDLQRTYARQQEQQKLERLRVNDARAVPASPETCPCTPDELLNENADQAELTARPGVPGP